MVDVELQLSITDGDRRFSLDVAFASAAPVIALYGPSGAGKSLTLQAIAGLVPPARGHVRIGDRTLYDRAAGIDVPASDRDLGYLFQSYALFPHLSVRENVAFGLTSWRRRLRGDQGRRVDELLETFGLSALASARPATLSGGQQQRAALARALASEPRALLLDEPFAALNPMLRHALRDELAAVRERWQIPIVLVTHDVDDVLALANVAFRIEEGRAVREVSLDPAESRDIGRQRLQPELEPRPPHPREAELRALLDDPGHA